MSSPVSSTVSVIIPTLNAGEGLDPLLESLGTQTLPCETIIADSSSTDNTTRIAARHGATICAIPRNTFDHGGTRTLAGKGASGDILIYMTQDALPADRMSLENLVKPFADPSVGAAFGRQLPRPDAAPFGAHLRLFNYPAASSVRRLADKRSLGIRTSFLSNSFAAYRRSALTQIGWFRERLIMGEDTCAGASLLVAGYAIAYAADATVYHSHDYTPLQEMRRYFDIGVFHDGEAWMLDEFGGAGREGLSYMRSAVTYLAAVGKHHLVPELLLRSAMKFAGYRLGRLHRYIPLPLAKRLSMHRDWWDRG
ncbi:MAG: glycosyltransferase family 2 protein [Nitrospiraceae bacterium]|nr:glycosyltransferase family 2 protein [Nitrospiraceae bacterium]